MVDDRYLLLMATGLKSFNIELVEQALKSPNIKMVKLVWHKYTKEDKVDHNGNKVSLSSKECEYAGQPLASIFNYYDNKYLDYDFNHFIWEYYHKQLDFHFLFQTTENQTMQLKNLTTDEYWDEELSRKFMKAGMRRRKLIANFADEVMELLFKGNL